MMDPTLRFSSRVNNYVKYRPRYPAAVLATLREECQLTPAAVIADIGSGTGFLAELFLQNGNPVFAVEPNTEMRMAGENILRSYAGFRSVAGRAEATTLADRSADFVVAGQAFHWFDREASRREFLRILKPAGWVVLVWNERQSQATPFLSAYEQLLQQYAPDYARVNHKQIDEAVLAEFYGAQGFKEKRAGYRQSFDHTGLQGRLLSSSYAPEPGHPGHEPMLAELAKLFQRHAVNGRVEFEYSTRMYYGRLC